MSSRIYLKGCTVCSKMSQSDLHRELVLRVAEALQVRYSGVTFLTDLQQVPGDAVPPNINGFRPDVYGSRKTFADAVVVAEAKTDRDLDNRHTYNQIVCFITYLEQKGNGLFVLSVTGCAADHAKTLMRFIRQDMGVMHTDIAVFDSCDFWFIDPGGGRMWHLS